MLANPQCRGVRNVLQSYGIDEDGPVPRDCDHCDSDGAVVVDPPSIDLTAEMAVEIAEILH